MLPPIFRRAMSSMAPRNPLLVVVGPTGTGKSRLAVTLAERFNGEIINGDALQMYEGLPITTNKISVQERKGIPHHLLGCVKLSEEPWTVHQFCNQATQAINGIRSRGKVPVLVGGTHYYTQSLLFPRSLVEEAPDVKERATADEEDKQWPILAASTEEMYQELRRVDPAMAKHWHPQDRRKIRRSLQIFLRTNTQASEVYKTQEQTKEEISKSDEEDAVEKLDPLIFWTYSEQVELVKRLDARVEQMIRDGLIDEVRSMDEFTKQQRNDDLDIDPTRGIWVAIGYKEFLPYIAAQESDEALKKHCAELTKIATRQYARRQVRWIRLKLLHAAQEAGLDRNFFLLDATDVSSFSSRVEQSAIKITEEFLHGRALPDTKSLSDTAATLLTSVEKESVSAKYCEVCDKTLMYQRTWEIHLQSKGHRRAVEPKVDWKSLYPKAEAG